MWRFLINEAPLYNTSTITTALLCVAATIILSIPIRALHRKLRIAHGVASIPGPKGTFLLGNMPNFIRNKNRIYHFLEELLQQYGGRMKMPWHLFFDGAIYITDPKDVEHILSTNFNNYIKPQGFIDAFQEIFKYSFFAMNHAHTSDNGEKWRLQRKIASKVFTTSNFKSYSEHVFTKYALQTVEKLQEQTEPALCDMQEWSAAYTLSSIFDIAFGTELRKFCDPHEFALRMNYVNEHCASRLFVKQYYKWFAWCMPSEYQLRKYTNFIRAIADQILDERLSLSGTELEEKYDILSLFIKKARELEDNSDLLSPDTLRSIILTFIFAGRDTTAECITYMFYALAKHPEIQNKIIEELKASTPSIETSSMPVLSYDLVKQLKYLDAVAYETVRLYPSLPYNVKAAVEDDYLPDGTFVPAGTDVVYSPWFMGREETRWGKDALVFRPERWLELTKRPTAYEFPAFQAGPRICLGMNMAILEAKIFTAVVLHHYTVQIQPDKETERGYVLKSGLFMKDGLPLQMIPRARAYA